MDKLLHFHGPDFQKFLDDSNPGKGKCVFFINPISWTDYKSVLEVLGINTNSFSKLQEFNKFGNTSFKSSQSFSRSMRLMENLNKSFITQSNEVDKKNGYSIRSNPELFLGDESQLISLGISTSSFLKESARLTMFLLDCFLRQLDHKLGLNIKENGYFSFDSRLGSSLKLDWRKREVDFFYRTYPLFDSSDDRFHVAASPLECILSASEMGQAMSWHLDIEELNCYTFDFSLAERGILFNLSYNTPHSSAGAFETDERWSDGPRLSSSNWTTYQFLLEEHEAYGISPLELNNHFEDDWYKRGSIFHFDEGEDSPSFSSPTFPVSSIEQVPFSKLKRESQISEIEILNMFKKLTEAQLLFLQDLIDLKKK